MSEIDFRNKAIARFKATESGSGNMTAREIQLGMIYSDLYRQTLEEVIFEYDKLQNISDEPETIWTMENEKSCRARAKTFVEHYLNLQDK